MSIGAYNAAIKNNWIDDITSHFDITSSKFYWNNKNRRIVSFLFIYFSPIKIVSLLL